VAGRAIRAMVHVHLVPSGGNRRVLRMSCDNRDLDTAGAAQGIGTCNLSEVTADWVNPVLARRITIHKGRASPPISSRTEIATMLRGGMPSLLGVRWR
jgi:hypothetical protein